MLEMRDRVVKFFSSQALLLMVEDIEARTALAEGKSSESAIRFEALLKKHNFFNFSSFFMENKKKDPKRRKNI